MEWRLLQYFNLDMTEKSRILQVLMKKKNYFNIH